jgi:ribosomal protein L11
MAHRATVNLKVLAGVAKPNPKMGQTLGPLGINMMQFCKVVVMLNTGFQCIDWTFQTRCYDES